MASRLVHLLERFMRNQNSSNYTQRFRLTFYCEVIPRLRQFFYFTALVLFFFPPLAFANPEGGVVAAGSATISAEGATTTINQSTDKAVIDWRSFNIQSGETTRFNQPASSSWTLNRVDTNAGASRIFGNLSANGNIMIINNAGILFGAGSRVDVNGLIASTANISNSDFMAGRFNFQQSPEWHNGIVNEGTIRAGDEGLVALIAPGVENRGVIEARMGKVLLAAGDQYTIDLYGDQLINFGVNAEVNHQVTDPDGNVMSDGVKNTGAIMADGGKVIVTARVASHVVENAINMQGIAQANSVSMRNGEIVLDGGSKGVVRVTGKLVASGKASGQKGGKVQVTGEKVGLFSGAMVDVSGSAGGGTILIGGDYQGKNPDVFNATSTIVGRDVTLNANALDNGNGGKVVVWADNDAYFYGNILAQGGAQAGDGGLVETSGKQYLEADGTVNTLATNGQTGSWLLDPANITIAAAGAATLADVSSFTTPTAATNSTIAVGTINAATANVIMQASNDITFNTNLAVSLGLSNPGNIPITLTLQAGRRIVIGNNTTITTQGGAVSFTTNETAAAGVVDAQRTGGVADINMGSGTSITTNGGNITFTINTGAGITNAQGGDIIVSTLNAGSGNVTLSNLSSTPNHSIITAAGGNSITANNVSLNLAGPTSGAGSIGTNGAQINVTATNLAALIANQTGGIFITSTQGVNLGVTGGVLNGIGISNTTGITTLVTAGAITDSGTSTTGNLTLSSGSNSNDITLDSAANNFGGIAITQAGNVTIADTGGVNFGNVSMAGNLNFTTTGDITQTAATALTIGGNSIFAASTANSITLGQNNNFTGTVGITSALNATILDTTQLTLAGITLANSGNLALTGAGISQSSGNIFAPLGVTTLTAGSGNDISLNSAGNDFRNVRVVSGNNATLRTQNSLNFTGGGTSTVSGNLVVNAGGLINQANAIQVTGSTTFSTSSNGITLTNLSNIFPTLAASAPGSIDIQSSSPITVGVGTSGITAGGSLTLIGGSLSQSLSAPIVVTGVAILGSVATNGINLSNDSNDFNAVTITTGAGSSTVHDIDDIQLGNTTTVGLHIVAGGAITQSGGTTFLNIGGNDSSFSAGNGSADITIANAQNNTNIGIVSFIGRDVSVYDNTLGITLNTSNITGNLTVDSPNNNINNNGAVTVAGTTNLTAGSGSVNLNTVANNFGGGVFVNSANNVSITNVGNLVLGTGQNISGTYTATSNTGNITDVGSITVGSFTASAATGMLLDAGHNVSTVNLTNTSGDVTFNNLLAGTLTVAGVTQNGSGTVTISNTGNVTTSASPTLASGANLALVSTGGTTTLANAITATGASTISLQGNDIAVNAGITNNSGIVNLIANGNMLVNTTGTGASISIAELQNINAGTLNLNSGNNSNVNVGALLGGDTGTLGTIGFNAITGANSQVIFEDSSLFLANLVANANGGMSVLNDLFTASGNSIALNADADGTGLGSMTLQGSLTGPGGITLAATSSGGGGISVLIPTVTLTSGNTPITINAPMLANGNTVVFDAGNGDITATNANNNFANVNIISGDDANLNDINNIVLNGAQLLGTLTVTAGGTITQTGALSGTTLTTSSVGGTTLNGANTFTGFSATNTTSGDIAFTNTGNLILGSINQIGGGNFILNNTGTVELAGSIQTNSGIANITSTGAVTGGGFVSGASLAIKTLNDAGALINLSGGSNVPTIDLQTRNTNDDANVDADITFVSLISTNINDIQTLGDFTLSSTGDITQNNPLVIAGTTTLTTDGSITLLDALNDFNILAVTAAAGTASINDINGITLGATNVDTYNITAGGAILDNTNLTIGTLVASAAGGLILDSANNNIGSANLTNLGSGNIILTVNNALLTLTGLSTTAAGSTNTITNSGGDLTVSGAVTFADGTSDNLNAAGLITINAAITATTNSFIALTSNDLAINPTTGSISNPNGTVQVSSTQNLTLGGVAGLGSDLVITNAELNKIAAGSFNARLQNGGAINVNEVDSAATDLISDIALTANTGVSGVVNFIGTAPSSFLSNVYVIASGDISVDTAVRTVNKFINFNSSTGDINLSANVTGDTGIITSAATGGIVLNNDVTLSTVNSNVTINDAIAANSNVLTFNVGSGDVEATDAGNTLSQVDFTSARNATIASLNILAVGNSSLTGILNLTADRLVQGLSSSITADTLIANAANGIIFDNLNIHNLQASNTTSENISLVNTGNLSILGISQSGGGNFGLTNTGSVSIDGEIATGVGDINLSATGAVTQNVGVIGISGTVLTVKTLNNAGAAITLNNATNNVSSIQLSARNAADNANAAGAISYTGVGDVFIDGIATAGTLNLTANGDIVQNGVLTVGGVATFTTNTAVSDILLNLAANDFASTIVITDNGNVRNLAIRNINSTAAVPVLPTTLNNLNLEFDNASITLPGMTLTGALTVISGGSITQSGALNVADAISLTLNNPNNDILLASFANNFAVTPIIISSVRDLALRNINATAAIPLVLPTGMRNLTLIFDNNLIDLPSVSLTGNLTATSGSTITQSGALSGLVLTTNSVGGTLLNGSNTFTGFNATNITSGNIAFTNTGALSITGVSQAGGGNFVLNNTGTTALDGNIATAAGSSTLNSTGAITQNSGAITGVTLTAKTLNNAGAAINLASATNSVTNIDLRARNAADNANVAGAITYQDVNAVNVNNIATLSTIGLTAGGAITQSGVITGTTLTSSSIGGTTLNGANTLTGLNATNTSSGDIAFTNTGALSITGVSQAGGGNFVLNNTGTTALDGNIATAAGSSTLNSTGAITQNSGAITGVTLTAKTLNNAGAAINLASATNSVTNIDLRARNAADNANVAGAITYQDANAVNVNNIATLSTIGLTAGGAITQSGAITGSTLTSSSVGGTTLNGANTLTGFNATNSSSGDVALTNTGNLSITGISQAGGGNFVLNNTGTTALDGNVATAAGNSTLNSTGAITQNSGAITGATLTAKTLNNAGAAINLASATNSITNIDLQARNAADNANVAGAISYQDANAVNVNNIATLSTIGLTAGGAITQSGAITGTTLTTTSVGGTSLGNANTITGFNATNTTSGDVTLTNTGALSITGVSQAGGGNFVLSNTGATSFDGNVGTGAGNSTVTSTGNVSQTTGSITGTTLTVKTTNNGGATINLGSTNNVANIDLRARNAADNANVAAAIAYTDTNAVNVNNIATLSTIALTAGGAITETAGSMTGTTLTISSVGGSTLNGTNTLSGFNATNSGSGDVAFTNTGALSITGVSQNGGGNFVLNNTGTTAIDGNVATVAGNSTLNSSSTLVQNSGAISGATLITSSVGGTTLNGANTLTGFNATNATSGDIAFTNTGNLSVTGVSQSGGNFALNNTGTTAFDGNVATGAGNSDVVSTGAVTQNSGAITGNALTARTQNNSGAAINLTGANNLASVDLRARNAANNATVNANLTYNDIDAIALASVTTLGDATITAGGNVTQTAATTANNLNISTFNDSGASISLTSSANNVANIDLRARNAANNANAAGVITYRDNNAVNVANVSTASTVNLTAGGAITQSGAITGTTLTTDSVGGTTLNAANNVTGFGATNTVSGDIAFTNASALNVTGISQAVGDLALTVGGNITQTGAIVMGLSENATFTVTAPNSSILLADAPNAFGVDPTFTLNGNIQDLGLRNINPSAVIPVLPATFRNLTLIFDNNSIQLPTLDLTGNLVVTAGAGTISQNAAINVDGTATLNANNGASDIVLGQLANKIAGLSVIANNVQIVNDTDINFGASTINGNFDISNNGNYTQSGNLTATGNFLINMHNKNFTNNATITSNTFTMNDGGTVNIGNNTLNTGSVTMNADTANGTMNANTLLLNVSYANLFGTLNGVGGAAAASLVQLAQAILPNTQFFNGIDLFNGQPRPTPIPSGGGGGGDTTIPFNPSQLFPTEDLPEVDENQYLTFADLFSGKGYQYGLQYTTCIKLLNKDECTIEIDWK